MHNIALEKLINKQLNNEMFQDYAPNGLQVEGRPTVRKIITGVTACQALLDAAVEFNADAILVHHGYFWKGESSVICGLKRRRLKTLLANDINLYAYHLPLDAHATLGNNAQLGQLIGVRPLGTVSPEDPQELLFHGEFDQPQSGEALKQRLELLLGRSVLHCGDTGPKNIRRIAWCSGGAQNYIDRAIAAGVDAFITGEVSEQTIHSAREMGIHFYAAGHHATERYGIKALGEWLAKHHDFEVTFVDIDNPA